MKILGNRVLVSKVEEPKINGAFQTVDVQDSSVYKGKVEQSNCENLSEGFKQNEIHIGDIILFAKYSPDTQEIDCEGKKMKIVRVEDVLAIL